METRATSRVVLTAYQDKIEEATLDAVTPPVSTHVRYFPLHFSPYHDQKAIPQVQWLIAIRS